MLLSTGDDVCHKITLEHLESIKQDVDPNGIFNCCLCIGNKAATSAMDNDALPTHVADARPSKSKQMKPQKNHPLVVGAVQF